MRVIDVFEERELWDRISKELDIDVLANGPRKPRFRPVRFAEPEPFQSVSPRRLVLVPIA
ncbi:MAG: hypothetical protein HN899_07365 [Gemmatimonadales bacterium]|nr:hypothetical protein [Gemmatimonadales bacterium]MBT7691879.1 hypothetical protein [Gemmatimonadales bacterium]